MRHLTRKWLLATLLTTAAGLAPGAARADGGFQLNRYEPSAAGESFFWVDRPWYSATRSYAVGLTLNYAHNPLVFGVAGDDGKFTSKQSIVEHALLGHVDLAASFLDR